jgi:SAM-dependent methyltransferase
MNDSDYGYLYAERQLSRSRNPLRKFIKGFYLRNLSRDAIGPTIDFGCGAGQLLQCLPEGSIGLEANKYLVSALGDLGLSASLYDSTSDQLAFKDLPEGKFETFIMSHVLEHFEDAAEGLKNILDSCNRLGIKRVIIVVPGRKGYLFDDTHRTLVDRAYISDTNMESYGAYKASSFSYFPMNIEKVGDYFTFHELKIIFDAA